MLGIQWFENDFYLYCMMNASVSEQSHCESSVRQEEHGGALKSPWLSQPPPPSPMTDGAPMAPLSPWTTSTAAAAAVAAAAVAAAAAAAVPVFFLRRSSIMGSTHVRGRAHKVYFMRNLSFISTLRLFPLFIGYKMHFVITVFYNSKLQPCILSTQKGFLMHFWSISV